ncbi:hypothetical protein [Eleftheria terrae]|uniref:hypothetical protein n=1 Tax=Eleftheria terrae TaxID=1597781 RepID=UPI00263ADCBE|nr:hypothetical protein [Eleftheria terrae]WKB50517.1 hypothetical protein N7L95_00275 [Eleftheria terrae]
MMTENATYRLRWQIAKLASHHALERAVRLPATSQRVQQQALAFADELRQAAEVDEASFHNAPRYIARFEVNGRAVLGDNYTYERYEKRCEFVRSLLPCHISLRAAKAAVEECIAMPENFVRQAFEADREEECRLLEFWPDSIILTDDLHRPVALGALDQAHAISDATSRSEVTWAVSWEVPHLYNGKDLREKAEMLREQAAYEAGWDNFSTADGYWNQAWWLTTLADASTFSLNVQP